MLIILLLTTLAQVTPQEVALLTRAYDCGINRQNEIDIATYSLIETKKCNEHTRNVNVTTLYGQIVQKSKIKEIMVTQCKIKLHRTVHRCSLFGYLEPVENGIQEYLIETSREQCKKLHETGYFAYTSDKIISDVKVNVTTTRSLYLAGDAIDNSCNTGSFSDRFGSYSKVLVHGLFTITLTSYTAKVDVENRNIFLSSGLVCEFDKMYCTDVLNGYTFWERITDENYYKKRLELIYEGNITKISDENETDISYIIDTKEYLIVLEDKGFIEVCYNKFIRTQSAETYILLNHENFLKAKHVHVDYNKYFSNKITVIYKRLESQIKDIYLEKEHVNCEHQISLIKEQLILAYTAPEQFAFNLMGPGFTAQLAGNVIHIVKCQPVEISINPDPPSCFQDIPILYHNKPLFMSSTSSIIIQHSKKIRCNKILPVKFRINGEWIKFTPTLKRAKAPRKLGPKPQENFKPTEIKDLEGRGLYSKEDINEYQNSINFPHERKAIIDNAATDIRDIKNTELIDTSENFFTAYLEKHVNKYWNNYKDFGAISAAIFMTITIIILIGYIINIILNAFQIKSIVGCSYKLGAALFSSTTNKILRKTNISNQEPKHTDIEDIELEDFGHKSHSHSKIPIPKPRQKFLNFIPEKLKNKKIQTSFRKPKKCSTETQVDVEE